MPSRASQRRIGAFQAKTHFSQLLARVAKGEEITITRHEKPIARLVPADRPSHADVAQLFTRLAEIRGTLKPGKGTLKDLINEGRRF